MWRKVFPPQAPRWCLELAGLSLPAGLPGSAPLRRVSGLSPSLPSHWAASAPRAQQSREKALINVSIYEITILPFVLEPGLRVQGCLWGWSGTEGTGHRIFLDCNCPFYEQLLSLSQSKERHIMNIIICFSALKACRRLRKSNTEWVLQTSGVGMERGRQCSMELNLQVNDTFLALVM